MSDGKTFTAGVGITRVDKQPEKRVKDLVRDAVTQALADAGCDAADLHAADFATAGQGPIEGQYMVAGQVALKVMGIVGIPVTNIENACASSSTALNAAHLYVESGAGDICLAVGVDKLYAEDKAKNGAADGPCS
ncbi:hypothetical protein G6F57_021688 [Rhizopus arrhizus]|nr:hypothetical protein G6F57_021688 [Rhizopus arrhizus]